MKKIFYSWQSDIPRDIGKDLVQEALDGTGANGLDPASKTIEAWARGKGLAAVAWTALGNNFNVNGFGKVEFSVDNAIRRLQSLEPKGKSAAAEQVWRAPAFIDTPLRRVRCSHGFGRRNRHA